MARDPRTPRPEFQQDNLDRDVPTCSGTRDGSCLSSAQKTATGKIFSGPTTSSGALIYASFPFDAGVSGSGIPMWEFAAPSGLNAGSIGMIFKAPPGDTEEPRREDARVPRRERSRLLRQRFGGLVQGPADGQRRRRLELRGFLRIPGMGHCSGGPATDQFDALTPLVNWVEQGQAPAQVIATARGAGNAGGANADVPVSWAPGRTRPLCPYPKVARYVGSGNLEEASNFRCE